MAREPSSADVAIIGAGAAGLATAIFLGRARPNTTIAALDGAARIGAKILVSGGGRCNVTNVRVTPADYYGGNPNVLRRVLAAFPAERTRAFFEELGVALHEEDFGKLFPDSNQARTVVNALLHEAERCGVQVLTERRVAAIDRTDAGFTLTVLANGTQQTLHARNVVLATGGLSLPKTGSDGLGYDLARTLGHSLVPTTPALDPLLLAGDFHPPLSGISQDVEIVIRVADHKPVRIAGPLLWTHFGVSGPAALNAARFWHRARTDGHTVHIAANLLPGRNFEQAEREFLDAAEQQPRAHVATVLHRWLPARVADAVLAQLNLHGDREIGQLPRDDRRPLLHALLDWPLPVVGTRGYKYAEVTAGGVPLSEINPATMESRPCPGLYLVGEILDVDGRIGGFNFQWAWSSAWVAASGLARRLARD